jgi:hypothetical protein
MDLSRAKNLLNICRCSTAFSFASPKENEPGEISIFPPLSFLSVSRET